MPIGSLIPRAIIAMLLTGIVSALLAAIGIEAYFSILFYTIGVGHASGALGLIGIFWFFGSFLATVCACILGLFVEWPKAVWLGRQDAGGFARQLLISLAGAEALALIWAIGAALYRSPQHGPGDVLQGMLMLFLFFAIGGACSAMFWWRLIVLPTRQLRRTRG